MKYLILFFSLICLISCNTFSQKELTAEQIWSKYIETFGDTSKIKKLQGLRIKSVIKQDGKIISKTELNTNNKDKLKMIIHEQSDETIYILNGNKALQYVNKTVRNLYEQEYNDLKKMVDSFIEINYLAHGFKIKLAGKDSVNGVENYKIMFYDKKSVTFYFIDTKTFLLTKMEDTQGTTYPSDRRNIDGIYFFFKTKMTYKKRELNQEIISIEINPVFRDDFFKVD